MPTSPPETGTAVDEVMAKIDKQILKQSQEDPCEIYRVVVSDTLSQAQRDQVVAEYVAAGWSSVYSKTSAENGERPGLLMFTLVY